MNSTIIKNMVECENLIKVYKTSEIEVVALQGLDLTVREGELMAIIGNSGSGKSTLLNMIGGLDRPTAGKLFVDGKDLFKMNQKQLTQYVKETVGFVWQNNARNLIPYLTALENIELVMRITGSLSERSNPVELLKLVGMEHRKDHLLSQMSGGEQQRVAIAIAISNNPRLLLADEPTGSVDTKTSNQMLELFRELNRALGLTIIIVTHDRQLESKVDRVAAIRDGWVSTEFLRKSSYADELKRLRGNSSMENNEETHIELSVVDKRGRLQIPENYLSILGLRGESKVKVEMEGEKIVIYSSKEA